MERQTVNQQGVTPIYIEKNEGKIFVGTNYVDDPSYAFINGSLDLHDYAPTIEPPIRREEVGLIKDWIERETQSEQPARLALLYGKAGIGKSVVMHDLLEELRANSNYLVLGLKSDQIEFVDTDDLSKKIHLAQPIEMVIREMTQKYQRVVLLIDQIDALSLSLSSNRTPLRSLLKLIGQIQNISNVRVVISCRPYDLEYDPLLDSLRIKNKWELKEFSKDQVRNILLEHKCKDCISDNLLQFLGNPLHLFLFLKVRPEEQLTNPLSTDMLYHKLWEKYVTNDSVRKVDKKRLLALLDTLVSTMYERQELSVHYREFETEYNAELQYLFTSELLILTKSSQVQFFHQTLFDYVYARRFIEKGYKLLEELKGKHQGLFLRAAVKSILTFTREQNPKEYIQTIEQLIYAQGDNGKFLYRYHLKSLALSNMAYFESPLQEEISLISRKIFSDKVYMNVLFETIHTPNWFNAIWDIIDKKGGWQRLNKDYKEKVMQMSQRSLWLGSDNVLETLEKALDYNNEEDCKYLGNLLQQYDLNCSSDRLIGFYNKLVKTRLPLEYIHLLRNILKENPVFVCQELKENVRLQLLEKESKFTYRIGITHDLENLYEEMLKTHHEEAIQLLVEILTLVYDKTKFEIKGSEIYNSTEFFSFQRTTKGHFVSNFVEDTANILIDDFLKTIEKEKTKQYVAEFSQSHHEGFVFIALFIYTSLPELFKDDVYRIIINRSVLANAPSWVEYQAVEALKKSFCLMSDVQKKAIINNILNIEDKGEYILYKDVVEMRLQYGHPILDIDLHKGKALSVIAKDELKRFSWDAYQERQRIDRKFKPARLINEKPSSFSVHSGWPSLREEQGLKMNCETWLKAMLTYTNNQTHWDKPSLTGQCNLFRDVVYKEPDKFIKFIDEIVHNEKVLLDYPQAGMQGLLDAGRINEAMHVLQGILDVIKHDVNSTVRGFSLHSLLFALNDVAKKEHVPEIVFDLFCNALLNAEELEDDIYYGDKAAYDVGINQSRGNAGYMLVQCAHEKQYQDGVFNTIEQIAETASVYTRAAILLNMAVLNFGNQKRNVDLFKKLLHDFNPKLMAMPVHNYNPLVYFVNYAVDDLMDFFCHAADCPDCYKEQVIIIWLAWSHNHRDERVKVFLDKMCESSQEARISLIKFLGSLEGKIDEDATDYIVHFFDEKYDSPEMGEVCDGLFFHAKSWPESVQHQVAEAYVVSSVSKYQIKTFISFLAGYAIKEPIQTLKWLELTLNNDLPDDYYLWNHIVDVLIQSYNGIKSFNDISYQDTLEQAMDMIDSIMQNQNNKYLITNFINKLDNE